MAKGVNQEEKVTETNTTALATNDFAAKMEQNKALAGRLPVLYKDTVMMLPRPTTSDIMEEIAKLPAEWQDKAMNLLRRLNPQKQGVHTSGRAMKVSDVRLYQGVGSDPSRPAKLAPGGIYTTDSATIETPFTVLVLGLHETRTLWPPLGAAERGPLCYSVDSVQGTRYGACKACPKSDKLPRDGGCTKNIEAYVLDKDWTGFYRIQFNKTSYRAGQQLDRIVGNSSEAWEKWISIAEQENKDGTKRWFTYKVDVADAKSSTGPAVPKAVWGFIEKLSQALDANVYYPALADSYDRAAGPAERGDAAASKGETFKNPMDDDAAPDYSNA